uniref:Putative reg-2-like protein n=1 Tax=Lutzomyia longipalpis TaxID=7200 RepID=A0A1B0CDC3_LUTLO
MNNLAKNLNRFRLITFDITDTLLRFKTAPAVQYVKAASKHGYSNVDQTQIANNFSRLFRQMTEKYPIFGYHHPQEIKGWRDWWRQLVIGVFEASHANIPAADLERIANYLIECFETSECWQRCSSAKHLVDDIQKVGKIIGVITNSDPRIRSVIRNLQLPEFDFITCSYEVGFQKPSHEIFDAAVQLAGQDVQSSESLHVGNTPHLDYLGAHSAGWTSILITNNCDSWKKYSKDIDTSKIFPTLQQFHEALKEKHLNL